MPCQPFVWLMMRWVGRLLSDVTQWLTFNSLVRKFELLLNSSSPRRTWRILFGTIALETRCLIPLSSSTTRTRTLSPLPPHGKHLAPLILLAPRIVPTNPAQISYPRPKMSRTLIVTSLASDLGVGPPYQSRIRLSMVPPAKGRSTDTARVAPANPVVLQKLETSTPHRRCRGPGISRSLSNRIAILGPPGLSNLLEDRGSGRGTIR